MRERESMTSMSIAISLIANTHRCLRILLPWKAFCFTWRAYWRWGWLWQGKYGSLWQSTNAFLLDEDNVINWANMLIWSSKIKRPGRRGGRTDESSGSTSQGGDVEHRPWCHVGTVQAMGSYQQGSRLTQLFTGYKMLETHLASLSVTSSLKDGGLI